MVRITKKYQDKKKSKKRGPKIKVTEKCRDKEWLYQKYVIERLSTRKIAKLCNCGQTTIFRYLKKYQISRDLSEPDPSKEYGESLAQIFIRDYGIDGERIWKQYNPHIRLICHECPEYKKCRGKKWKTDNCEPWLQFAEVTGFDLTKKE